MGIKDESLKDGQVVVSRYLGQSWWVWANGFVLGRVLQEWMIWNCDHLCPTKRQEMSKPQLGDSLWWREKKQGWD